MGALGGLTSLAGTIGGIFASGDADNLNILTAALRLY